MDKTLLESVLGKNASDKAKAALLESIENRAGEIASERVEEVERKYASQFSTMTESVSATLVDMADDAFKKAADKAVKDDSVSYLMESVNKIRGILEDIGVVVGDSDENLQARMAKAEDRYQKGLELLQKAKNLVDENKDNINKLRVENYIRKSMTGMKQDVVEQAVANFGDEDIDEIEDVLTQWLENDDFTVPPSPTEKTMDIDGLDEDEIEKDLEELGDMVSKSMFEAEGDNKIVKKPESRGGLDNIKGLSKMTTPNGYMPDVSGAQLEALANMNDKEAMFEGEDEQEILATDVDSALKQINSFGKNWKL